jgi:adenylate kinase family enzyme
MAARILVGGVTGVGKTTLARQISERTGVPHTEIDSLYHGPNWVPRDEFLTDVRRLAATDGWVTEWQYREARHILTTRADVLVWLDYPWRVAFGRVVRRTIRRRVNRIELWNGNAEGPLWRFFTDRDHIVRWSIRTRRKMPALVAQARNDNPHLTVIQLRSQRETDAWLDTL